MRKRGASLRLRMDRPPKRVLTALPRIAGARGYLG